MKTIYAAAAAALALSASAATAQQGGSLQCGGTEPFWGLTITAKAMWLTNYDQQHVGIPASVGGRIPPEGTQGRGTRL